MTAVIAAYAFYLMLSIALTIWVARTLFHNGRVFLVDVFHGNDALADSVNHLLVVGFYLINLGYVSLMMKTGDSVVGPRAGLEMLADKMGLVLLVLGGMHFFNLYLFTQDSQNRDQRHCTDAVHAELARIIHDVLNKPTQRIERDLCPGGILRRSVARSFRAGLNDAVVHDYFGLDPPAPRGKVDLREGGCATTATRSSR